MLEKEIAEWLGEADKGLCWEAAAGHGVSAGRGQQVQLDRSELPGGSAQLVRRSNQGLVMCWV